MNGKDIRGPAGHRDLPGERPGPGSRPGREPAGRAMTTRNE